MAARGKGKAVAAADGLHWADLREALRRRRLQLGLAALSGVLYFLGFCGFGQFYLAWVCLVPVLWALDDATLSVRGALAIAWVFGFVTHLGAYTWIIGMLRDFGALPLPLAVLGYALLCLGQSTLLAAWGLGTHLVVTRLSAPLVWAAPVLMVLAEWTWPALFPSYLANSQYEQIPFIQSADVWGVLGLSFLLALTSSSLYAALAALVRRRRPLPVASLAAWLAVTAGNFLYGQAAIVSSDDSVRMAERRVRVGVVQTNMGIYEKHEDPGEGLRRHREQSLEVERQGADLIVWPESGYNYAIRYDAEKGTGTTNVAGPVLGPLTTPLIFGGLRIAPGTDGTRRIYNTAFATDSEGNIRGTYDKTYLLAFGEYLPLGDLLPFLYDLSPRTSRFTRGAHTQPLELDGVKYGVLICYEDIIPRFVQQVMAFDADVLVNVTNDAWFGRTAEPRIHLALATFRAVEQRRYLVRAANTGVSAVIDPAGRILDPTPIFARANVVRDVTPLHGVTLYRRLGDWPAWACLLVLLVWTRAPLRAFARRLAVRAR